ncbi:MAG: dTDP-4-dehydrorhamnose reductase [candidate division NC10 bacterium]|nr:dTDP-4-dehydrorhamnose reductase [candidate division NC10 bacterium]
MRVVVTGAKGQLGHDLVPACRRLGEVVGLDLPEWDLTRPEGADRLAALRPDWVIHAAAATDVDRCEREPAWAMAINAEGTSRVAGVCRRTGAGLLYISTDYVFDGTRGTPYLEDDSPSARSAYGRSKLEGERFVQGTAPRWAIARSAWLYGTHGKNFVKTILHKARGGERLRVVDDQVGSPTYAADLAGALVRLLERRLTGVFHLTNSGACSWFEFTREILRQGGMAGVSLEPITSGQLNRPAPRPAYSVLANRAWQAAGESPLRFWTEALGDMLRSLEAAA